MPCSLRGSAAPGPGRIRDFCHGLLVLVREELVVFAGMAAVLIFVAAVGIYHFEHEQQPDEFASVFHGLWWAIVTLTTVGYGDAYPVTTGGRVFAAVVVLLGIGIVAVPTGLFASALSRAREMESPNETHRDGGREKDWRETLGRREEQ